jgi:hypothetical protein
MTVTGDDSKELHSPKTAEGLEAVWTGALATCPAGVKPGGAGLNQMIHELHLTKWVGTANAIGWRVGSFS